MSVFHLKNQDFLQQYKSSFVSLESQLDAILNGKSPSFAALDSSVFASANEFLQAALYEFTSVDARLGVTAKLIDKKQAYGKFVNILLSMPAKYRTGRAFCSDTKEWDGEQIKQLIAATTEVANGTVMSQEKKPLYEFTFDFYRAGLELISSEKSEPTDASRPAFSFSS